MEKISRALNKAVAYTKSYYSHILSAALIVVLILIVYGRDLETLVNEALQNEGLTHVFLIPFFAGFLFYLKRNMVKGSLALEKHRKKTKIRHVDELIGVIVCLVAFLIYWYGSYTFYPLEYHLLSLPIFVMGVTLVLFNLKSLVVLIFPILFLLFIIPPPSEFMYAAGGTLANFNTQASYATLKTFGVPVSLSSTYGPPTLNLTTSAGQPASFTVDLPCSGIYSLIAFCMFAAFLALVASASALKKIGVFVIGFFIFEIMNIIRITTIISVAYWFGEEVAMFIYHGVAGLLLIFIGMLLTLFIADKILKIQVFQATQEKPACPKCRKNSQNHENFCLNCGKFLTTSHAAVSQKFWAKLFLLLLGCSILTISINAPTFAIAQGPIGVTSSSGWQNATNVFPQIPDYNLTFLYRDTDYERIAHQDASLMYAYIPVNKSDSTVYVDVGVASSVSNLHNWEVCLITLQTAQGQYPLVSVLSSRDIQLLEGVPLIARYLTFTNPQLGNLTQVTLYWYERATFSTGITVEQKYVRISLIILTTNATNYNQYEDELLPFGQTIASFWEPLKTQSLVSLGVPAQQLLLILSIAFVAFTKTVQYSNEWRNKNNNLKIFNKLASTKEKFVLKTIMNLAKKKKTMETSEISTAIKQAVGKSMRFHDLLDMLSRLNNYGFLKKDIVSVKNRPVLIWKT